MEKEMLRIFFCCGTIFVICAQVHIEANYKNGDVVLGGIFSVHFKGKEGQCGDFYLSGLGRAEAMSFAIEEINKDSSLLPNITLGYDMRDYCENATLAMRTAMELITETCTVSRDTSTNKKPIVALVGPYDSSTALLVGGILEVFHIPGISGTTTSAELSSHVYKHFYRTAPSDSLQAKAMADIIEYFGWTYVAAVGLDDSYGRNGIWSVQKEAAVRKSFCVASTEFVRQNVEAQNIQDIVWKLKQHENVKVIVVWIYGGYGRRLLDEANRQNLTGRVWILSEGLTSEGDLFLDRNLLLLDGSIGIQPHDYPNGGFKNYLKRMCDGTNEHPITKWWQKYWAFSNSHDNARNDSFSLKFSNCEKVIDQMYSSYTPYIIDAIFSVAHALNALVICAYNSQLNCKVNVDSIRGNQVERELSNVAFDGLTGKVEFDELGDRRAAVYDIVSFQLTSNESQQQLRKVTVGEWHKDTNPELSLKEPLFWNAKESRSTPPKSDCVDECAAGTRKSTTSPCCWQCIPCLPGTINPTPGSSVCMECPVDKRPNEEKTACVDLPSGNLVYTSSGGIAFLVLSVFGIVVTAFMIGLFYRYSDTPIIKASNSNLSIGFLVGVALLFSLVLITLAKPTDTLCKTRYIWRYLTYNLCMSFLLVKILRIANAFRVQVVRWSYIQLLSARSQVLFLVLTQVSLFFIISPWIILDPPFKKKFTHPEKRILIECEAYSSLMGRGLYSLSSFYIYLQTILCAFCSFKARRIPENFSETKRISFSMYIFLLSLLTYHPVEFSLHGWYVTAIDCVTTLLSGFGFLFCIFLPKVYIVLLKPEMNSLKTMRAEVSKYSFRPNVVYPETQLSNSDSVHTSIKNLKC